MTTTEAVAERPEEEQQLNPTQQEEAALNDNRILVMGQPLAKLPDDLYIPPNALEIFLEAFEGPLDLLLYLIKRNNMDILDIQVATITAQYMEYVELMQSSQFDWRRNTW